MKLKYDPLPFVLGAGKPYHKVQILHALGKKGPLYEEALAVLEAQQNPDGGFPGRGQWSWIEKKKKVSATAETAESLYLLARYNIKSKITGGATAFLIEHQREDGGWAENPELGRYIPNDVTWISSDRSIPWMTGVVAKALLHSGYSEWNVELTKNFLLETQTECGTWPYIVGEQASIEEFAGVQAIVEALLLMDIPKEHPVVQKAIHAVTEARSMWEDNLLYASSALRVFWLLEYEKSHHYVKDLIEYILGRQRPDGAWGDEKPHPEGTAQFVQLLGDWDIYYQG